jgi:hypothetical protein
MTRLFSAAALAVSLCSSFAAPSAHAQTEFFADGLVYSLGGFVQNYEVEDVDVNSFGVEIGGMATPQFGVSLGFGQASFSNPDDRYGNTERATTLSIAARFVASRAETNSPLSADVAFGVGRASVGSESAISGLFGINVALVLDPDQPILVAPSFEGAIAFPLFFSDVETTTTISPGLSVGLRVAPGAVVFARPNYTFASGGEQAFETLGVSFGVALLN